MAARHRVVLLPGSVLPAEPAYAALLDVLGKRVDAVPKNLEVYAGTGHRRATASGMEVEGLSRSRRSRLRPLPSRRLLGRRGRGARLRRRQRRAASEPGRPRTSMGGQRANRGRGGLMQRFRALESLPADEFMAGFTRLQLAPGVEPPPPPKGPPRRGWPSDLLVCAPSSVRSTAVTSTWRLCGLRSAGVLRARRPQQPRLLRSNRGAIGRDLPRFHPRAVLRAPPLRPAAPGRARAPRQFAVALWQRAETQTTPTTGPPCSRISGDFPAPAQAEIPLSRLENASAARTSPTTATVGRP